ncbi:MAG: hypothetical protein NTW76_00630 [Corynebacteriales bacterium]|uniref:Uncharacterized protein n=1 Tax=Williamsia herbipolensis TaxID=1603258 RepID=A0AAU4K7L1_9NOCA|nr:hypothetical protein [Williamsia herbipolensis]MCX6467810.1 hypothetical protein [Mycobacteriales bacterium]
MMCTVSSAGKYQSKTPAVQSHTHVVVLPSRLESHRASRATGEPERIHAGLTGETTMSTSSGV